jgi:hypothetical protein
MRPPNDKFTIRNPEKVKIETKAKFIGSAAYWDRCVRRISIYTDTYLTSGYLEKGRVDLDTRFDVCLAFREFMKKYASEIRLDRRPFNKAQEQEIRRVLKGGLVAS